MNGILGILDDKSKGVDVWDLCRVEMKEVVRERMCEKSFEG